MSASGDFPAALAASSYVCCALGPVIASMILFGHGWLELAGQSGSISTLLYPVMEVQQALGARNSKPGPFSVIRPTNPPVRCAATAAISISTAWVSGRP